MTLRKDISSPTQDQAITLATDSATHIPVAPEAPPRGLLEEICEQGQGVAISFAGQGVHGLDELAQVLLAHPSLSPWIHSAQQVIDEVMLDRAFAWSGLYEHGFSLLDWLDEPQQRPPESYLSSSGISQPLIFIVQVIRFLALREEGLGLLWQHGAVRAVTGHSQGMMPALLVASSPMGQIHPERFADFVRYFLWQGLAMARSYEGIEPGQQTDGSPMAAVSGLSADSLERALQRLNRHLASPDHVSVALYNTRTRHVVSGPTEALLQLRAMLEAQVERQRQDKRKGRFAGRVDQFTWEFLAVGAAFHSRWMQRGLELMRGYVQQIGFSLTPQELLIDAYSPEHGQRFQEAQDLTQELVTAQFVRSVRWTQVTQALATRGDVDWVLDLGPGDGVARLLRSGLRGTGLRVLPLTQPEAQSALFTPGAPRPAENLDYRDLAPRLLQLPDGKVVVDNLYTRATGQSPMILPGMTPTTADVPLVAAACNAGFTAELAGGGQVTEAVFAKRLEELSQALEPGSEVVFNSLFLDPWLWGLHLGRKRLVQKARQAGAPIAGVTISAGTPEVKEAVALLDELAALGMWHNAFKPGTLDQLRQVVRIAQQAPQHTLFVHLEGGRAGGHHSWEDLEDLLLDGYHLVREQPNLILCVGGGVGSPQRAAELLSGRWSLRHDMPLMPVDAILLGTVTMACAEAATSPQVKQALAQAAGTDRWVFSGQLEGGVTSGRSQLNADIHYLENAAARCGRLLDEVAGDADAVASRRQELIEALNATAKPFFGELSQMSYLAMLQRAAELMAVGRHGRYEDGPWLDSTWRDRFTQMVHLAEARLIDMEEGSFPSFLQSRAQLDEPAAFLQSFAQHYPQAAGRTLHPLDVDAFVAICRQPGKPVNFVPVLDADVRRWYKADSLWQAHDDRYSAEQVLIIPGPEALAGIERADEPVAQLLGRFEDTLVQQLQQEGVKPAAAAARHLPPQCSLPHGLEREHLGGAVILRATDLDQAPDWLDYAARAFQGPAARLLGARRLYDDQRRSWPNPLHSLCRPEAGATLTIEVDGHGEASSVVWSAPQAGGQLAVRSQQGQVWLEVQVPALEKGVDPAVYRRAFTEQQGAFVESAAVRRDGLRDFYHLSLFGRLLQAVPMFEEATEQVSVDAEQLRGYRSITGAVSAAAQVPAPMAFSLIWRPLMRALSCEELAGGLLDLVHLSNDVLPGPGWPVVAEEALEARARITRVEDSAAGRQVTSEASLWRGDQLCASVTSRFFIRGDYEHSPWLSRAREQVELDLHLSDEAALAYLCSRPWLTLEEQLHLVAGQRPSLQVTLEEERPRHGEPRWTAQGQLVCASGVSLGQVALEARGALEAHPVRVAAALLAAPGPVQRDTSRRTLARCQTRTPSQLEPFALASRDLNPIHRSLASARLAQLDEPIVHGMWTAARMHSFVVQQVAAGREARISDFDVQFLAPALKGEPLELVATRVGVREGHLKVEITAEVTRGQEKIMVARGLAVVEPPRTAYVLPGQGIQRQGMGMESYGRSTAARQIWDRADRYTRQHLGFSILRVVRDNPTEIIIHGEPQIHPRGVLHLTRFTQVAMAVMAVAQVAELREAGVLVKDAITCGHSVGEYNALAAIAQVLPLEDVVEIVFQRGTVMHSLVPRDAKGASDYRMGVIRPNCARLDHAGAEALVAQVREQTGLPVEIVNYNIRGWQYSVTGHKAALKALEAALEARRPVGGKPPYIEVPGIDVPFHSRVLADGVESFRQTLQRRLPLDIDANKLLGRYIPNLVPRAWSLDRAYLEEVHQCTDSQVLRDVLDNFDRWSESPAELARVLLIELLAWQFASPVRWIETQELMMRPVALGGLGVERLIEVGVGYQPTLCGMARGTLRAGGVPGVQVEILNVEADAERVFYQDTDPSPEPVEAPAQEAPAAAPAAVAAPAPVAAPVAAAAGPVQDAPLSIAEALKVLLALQARVRVEQIRDEETVDELFEGVSSRRNQVLLDMGAEFGVGAIDGAHEKPISDLAAELKKRCGAYQAPGAYLRGAQEEALSRVMGRARLRRPEVAQHLSQTWGLEEGWHQRILCALALEAREGDSNRGGALGKLGAQVPANAQAAQAALDELVQQAAASRGAQVGRRQAGQAAGGAVDAAAVRELEERLAGPQGLLAQSARDMLERLGEARPLGEPLPEVEEATARLKRLEAEISAEEERLIAPMLDANKHVAFTSAWAWAQRDVARFYFEARKARWDRARLQQEAAALGVASQHRRSRDTAGWYARQARREGLHELAEALEVLALAQPAPLDIHAARPQLEVDQQGKAHYSEQPQDAHRFLQALWGEPALVQAEGWQKGLEESLRGALTAPLDFAGRTALVTGASPGSIAVEVVRHLLRGGARVVVTTTTYKPGRLAWYRDLYQRCAASGAELHVIPFNQASFTDTEALVDWLFNPMVEQVGAASKVRKRPFAPDLILPFGALGDVATLDSPGERSVAVVRAMLLGVERLLGAVGRRYLREGLPQRPCHVVLPLSPNHGSFGGDGAYAETKAALEVVLQKWHSERGSWGQALTLCGARIGWVRGTGLMDANNPVAARLEEKTGARTFSSGEMGLLLAACCTAEAGRKARHEPLRVDLTGGFADIDDVRGVVEGIRRELGQEAALAAGLHQLLSQEAQQTGGLKKAPVTLDAVSDGLAVQSDVLGIQQAQSWPSSQMDLSRAVVIVGAGEVGPLGHARSRHQFEVHNELSASGVLELAWVTGLVRYEAGQWVDGQSGEPVPEGQIAARYRQEVHQRVGIRMIDPEVSGYDPDDLPVMAQVYLERDFSFLVSSEEEARLFVESDPEHTRCGFDPEQQAWRVLRLAGSQISVPRKIKLRRQVAGLIPTGFDFARYGISPDMIENVDRVTLFNLIATVDAFLSAGITPEELLTHLHPARVANTQGSGIGGMRSIKKLYVDYVLGLERQGDVLQETLINVVAAYVVQSYVGSYGAMSHPVAACATAAVSLEEGLDKILMGRADFVVAGGFDDIGREGAIGFSDMNATADSLQMASMGLEPWQMSRSNDARRRGFVESQGGGTLLLARGDVALRMGLPVLGVLAWAGSFGDGIHKSIPAPGMGALSAAMGGASSPLGRALQSWGLVADDIAVAYKHDTSTQANDPNENALHHRIQEALGRSQGNPLWVVSQKTLTGHPKGGAAAWQTIGLCQSLSAGVIPGNRNLDSVDAAMEPWRTMAFTDKSLHPGGELMRAGLVTSLGFGHVGAIALVLHPAAFVAQLDEEQRLSYEQSALAHLEKARQHWARVWMGQQPAFQKRTERRFDFADGTACQEAQEASVLLNPDARLDPQTGRFVVPEAP